MALTDPKSFPGIECILRSVSDINEHIDDLEWWRATLLPDDDVPAIVGKMDFLDADEQECLLEDLARLGDHGQAMILAAIRFALHKFDGIDIDWHPSGPQNVEIGHRVDPGSRKILTMVIHLDDEGSRRQP